MQTKLRLICGFSKQIYIFYKAIANLANLIIVLLTEQKQPISVLRTEQKRQKGEPLRTTPHIFPQKKLAKNILNTNENSYLCGPNT
jgi:hypothetical protein